MILFDPERVAFLMQQQGIDVLLPHTQPNAGYLADYWSHWIKTPYYRGEEGLDYALFVGLARDPAIEPFITCRTGGEESDMVYSEVWIRDTRLWGPTSSARAAVSASGGHGDVAPDAITAAVRALQARKLDRATIGVELRYLDVLTFAELQRRLPDARFVDATPLFHTLRQIKTEPEITRLRAAAKRTENAYAATFEQMKPGTNGFQLEQMLATAHVAQGTEHHFTHVNLGPRGAILVNPSDERVEAHKIVRLDTGCRYRDYHSDISRVAVLGTPDKQILDAYRAARRAYDVMFEHCRAGVKCATLYETVARVLTKSGMPVFCAMVGHGVGRDLHEAPYITADNPAPLEKNMVITIEIALLLRDVGAMCLEDMVVVQEDGPMPLSTCGKELFRAG